MTDDVLVIGAGPAGIASAYYLQQAGIAYRVVDAATEIASTWNRLYPSLRLNTSRFFSHMPNKRFPLHYGIFPTAKQYHAYLLEFVKEHQLKIDLGVFVRKITPCDEGWQVETNEGTFRYRAVISATGRFNSPYTPPIAGLDQFKGQLLHAHDYVTPAPFKAQRVLVVGSGPSGLDIAVELGNVAKTPVLLAVRTGIVLRPRYPLGLPKHAWVMIAEALPKRLGARLEAYIENIAYRNLDKIGIKTPKPGEMGDAASTRGNELIRAVRAGRVRCVDGLASLDATGAHLDNGDYHAVDAVILATGYRPVLYQYFDYAGDYDNQNWALRDTRVRADGREVLGYEGLYLVGVFYKGKGAMYNFNVEAKTAVEQIQARLGKLG